MKKIVLIVSVLLVFTALSANTNMNFQQNFNEFTNKEWGEFAREVNTHIRDLRDLYMLEVLYEDWEVDTWVNDMKNVYTYDGSSYLIEMLTLVWEEDEWQNSLKMVMTNNTEGYPIEMMYQMWEPTSQIWMDMMIIYYTYDANWNNTEMLMQMWFGTAWINASRYTMTYNTDNNPTYILQETWDLPNGTEWENDQQETYTYDGLFLEEMLEEVWENDSEWIWDERLTYTEAGNNRPADRLDQGWNGGGYWDNQRYSQYTYDGDWNEIEDYEQEWNNGAWVNFETHFYTYDDGMMTERLTHRWETTRNWVNYHKQTMTYGTLDSEENTISPANDLLLTNYPNPFNPQTTIEFSIKSGETGTLEIYNLKGQMIHSQEFTSGDHSFIWNALNQASGIYFYKLKTDDMETTNKMILMK